MLSKFEILVPFSKAVRFPNIQITLGSISQFHQQRITNK
jgi:hypothetical protein